ncbi:MAG: iron ABC transporter permease [Clostridiales bacterium]|nr:iron ABC transporter permease [Clostridiales bacterium]
MKKEPLKKTTFTMTGGGLLLLLVIVVIWAAAVGSVSVPISQSAKIVLAKLPFVNKDKLLEGIPRANKLIIWDIRLPRVLLAGLVGGGLASAGVVMQALFRNPLADPQVLGISSGAAFGAAIAIAFGITFTVMGISSIWMFAFIGAILTMLLVFRVARIATSRSITGILLAGIACSSMLTAAITLLMMWNRQKLEQIYLWMLGSFSAATWVKVGFMAIVLTGAVICFAFLGRDLDLLSFGDQEAQSMGVSVKRTRTTAVIATSLLVAASVSVSGIIGFVSLIIPHIMRLLVGPKNRRLIPLSLLGGAIFMILCDMVSRTAAPPAEIAVGAITQVTGAPFFLYLLWKERRREERE